LQVEEKQEAADTLVAVGKRAILDHEIEQMGSATLDRWIKQLSVKCLVKIAQNTVQSMITLAAEKIGSLRVAGRTLIY